ncbi:MAG: hypothetical protein JKY42_04620 [Flavobacteriales bacterium]|nr:hypothetical protein [Flavobacteriales bacterium]
MNRIALVLVVLVTTFSSCSPKIQFTQAVKEQHQLTDEEMKKLQFYTSGDIVLQRNQKDESGKETDDGELIITSGSSIDQVIIPAGTPGIVIALKGNNAMLVRFEPGERKYLVFGDPKDRKGAYQLIPEGTKGGKQYVTYAGKKYSLSGTSQYVSLTFKMKRLNKFRKDEHVVKGMKL